MSYALLDSGNGRKLEKIGPYIIDRPALTAYWNKTDVEKWKRADAVFTREDKEGGKWVCRKKIEGTIEIEGVKLKVVPTDFGHLGFFPEHAFLWKWMFEKISSQDRKISFLNLFAYSGGASIAAAKAKASVCHLDASQPMVALARENAAINNLDKAPIRYIVDDVQKFLKREEKRGSFYDAILLDPPTYGRGAKKEVFKLEDSAVSLLESCKAVLSKNPLFVIFSCHTPGFTPLVLEHLLRQVFGKGKLHMGELFIPSLSSFSLPSGNYAIWEKES